VCIRDNGLVLGGHGLRYWILVFMFVLLDECLSCGFWKSTGNVVPTLNKCTSTVQRTEISVSDKQTSGTFRCTDTPLIKFETKAVLCSLFKVGRVNVMARYVECNCSRLQCHLRSVVRHSDT
jgi:hypothetical protein